MDHTGRRQPMQDVMESCRVGSDDLHDPRFAELAARLSADAELAGQFKRRQRADAAIKAAFQEIPIPSGLVDRIAARLAESKATAQTTFDSKALRPVWISRRRFLIGAASLSAAAVLLLATIVQLGRGHRETPASVLEETMQFFTADNRAEGELASRVPPPAEFPMSGDLISLRGVHWRRVPRFLGSPGVAYDLPSATGGRATLYVSLKSVPGLPVVPPSNPDWGTGGSSAAAWQVGETLYVLVVEGDAVVYRSYLDPSRGPLT